MSIIKNATDFYKKNPVKVIAVSLLVLMGLIFAWYLTLPLVIIIFLWRKFKKDEKAKMGTKKKCPHCQVEIDWLATRCPNCQGKMSVWTADKKIAAVIIIALFFIGIVKMSSPIPTPTSSTTSTPASIPVVNRPQTFEDRIRILAIKTGVTDINFNGIDDEKADSDRPVGSRMITVKLNVPSYWDADSFYGDTGEVTGKVFRETFASNPKAYDVLTWFYSPTTDKYGNTSNSVILTYLIDKETFHKINWENFNSENLCNFLKSEARNNNGDTGCVTLANIK